MGGKIADPVEHFLGAFVVGIVESLYEVVETGNASGMSLLPGRRLSFPAIKDSSIHRPLAPEANRQSTICLKNPSICAVYRWPKVNCKSEFRTYCTVSTSPVIIPAILSSPAGIRFRSSIVYLSV